MKCGMITIVGNIVIAVLCRKEPSFNHGTSFCQGRSMLISLFFCNPFV